MGRHPLRRLLLDGLAFAMLCAAGVPAAGQERLGADPEVAAFIGEMVTRHGFERAALEALFAGVTVQPNVIEAISRPAEAKPWHQYRPIFVTRARIDEGVEFWIEHRELLARVEAEYGVPAEIIVAIIGVETRFGTRTGNIDILESLSTLAFRYPRRSEFFRKELEAYLLLCRDEGFDPKALRGSYAGAMGVPQFISSSYRRYAVDYDRDGRRDLLHGVADAAGSVGNYLAVHGWRRGAMVTARARVSGDGHRAIVAEGIEPSMTIEEMRARGVSVDGDLSGSEEAALIELEGEEGLEYWMGLRNFYVITRYNHSALYAMAVYQLAEAIREGFQRPDGAGH